MSESPGDTLRDQMDRDPSKKCHCTELAARVWGLNDQVEELKELLRESIADLAPGSCLVMEIEAALSRER